MKPILSHNHLIPKKKEESYNEFVWFQMNIFVLIKESGYDTVNELISKGLSFFVV